jgi:PAS domain-containing protein
MAKRTTIPKNDWKRTTVRLPPSLHRSVRDLAVSEGIAFEKIVERALSREIIAVGDKILTPRHAVDLYNRVKGVLDDFNKEHDTMLAKISAVDREWAEWSPLMAYRFLQSSPALSVIKDGNFKIVWCNAAYERTLDVPLSI